MPTSGVGEDENYGRKVLKRSGRACRRSCAPTKGDLQKETIEKWHTLTTTLGVLKRIATMSKLRRLESMKRMTTKSKLRRLESKKGAITLKVCALQSDQK